MFPRGGWDVRSERAGAPRPGVPARPWALETRDAGVPWALLVEGAPRNEEGLLGDPAGPLEHGLLHV